MAEIFLQDGIAFALALVLSLVLTPIVREFNRRIGMVDKPDPRRINKVPVPRGGGLALFLSVVITYLLCGVNAYVSVRPLLLSFGIVALGYADDRFSLPPRVKLLGQVAVAVLAWAWAGLGFRILWPSLPVWLDGILTVFWITGAVNAFNLIDGLDGLASGIALIATCGMAGALVFSGHAQSVMYHFALAGGLLGFLRYNYNPASVFLGDSGSMYLGFTLSVLPLVTQTTNSFLVSVGVPLLAMGVPIFDTALAILRRSIRRLLWRNGAVAAGTAAQGEVMRADTDHLHHRILRSVGLSQRRAAWILYAIAAFLVIVGLCGMTLETRAGGLWLAALSVASFVIFRDLARVELFDAGRLLNSMVRSRDAALRRRLARLAVPICLACDVLVLVLACKALAWADQRHEPWKVMRVMVPVRVASVFLVLVLLRVYRTVWSRAMMSNYVRLAFAVAAGAVLGSVSVYYLNLAPGFELVGDTAFYAFVSGFGLILVRVMRSVIRDAFYALDCRRIVGRRDVSRVLVYGAGLRYRAFRRELVRSAASNSRIIVGLLDDDLILRHHFIGGIEILGTLDEAPEVINATNASCVVIACDVSSARLDEIRRILAPTGVKVTLFKFGEFEIS